MSCCFARRYAICFCAYEIILRSEEGCQRYMLGCGVNCLNDLIGKLSRASPTMKESRQYEEWCRRSHVTQVTHSKRRGVAWPEPRTRKPGRTTVIRSSYLTSHPPPSESVTLRVPGGHARQSAELLEPAARVVDPCGQVTHAPGEIEPVIAPSSRRVKHG